MVALTAPRPAEDLQADAAFLGGTALGKRYTHPADSSLEVLVTKPGDGTLGDGSTPLVVKESKPLPASD